MRLRIRRVGNSLGIIIPKATLDAWGVREGGALELSDSRIQPSHRTLLDQDALDELKRRLAIAVASLFPAALIRAQSLANLTRWRQSGFWVSAFDEWKAILDSGDDGQLFLAMLGRDERSVRLRLSPPYVGLLSRAEVKRINEEVSA
jgi:antitoxin component of MazEF toxin-antitoxin module